MVVKEIGAEGAKALSEKLKMNTVLSSLTLLCMKKKIHVVSYESWMNDRE